MPKLLILAIAILASNAIVSAQGVDEARLRSALGAPGYFGLMRHAVAPGSDDPPNFRLGDCSTQRNLSSGGRTQAAAIGERLRAAGLANVRLVSSQWCRCLDTARLLAIGPVEELPFLNSLVSYPGRWEEMTRDVRHWVLAQPLDRPTILVTHQVNIGALVDTYPNEGDIVVVERRDGGELRVLGTITAN